MFNFKSKFFLLILLVFIYPFLSHKYFSELQFSASLYQSFAQNQMITLETDELRPLPEVKYKSKQLIGNLCC